jgi:hypothetical protein
MSLNIINRSKVKLIPIEYDYNISSPNSEQDYYGENVGKYPLVFYKGLSIESDDISNLILENDDFLPKLKIEFKDRSNKIFTENYPKDNDIISIFIRAQNESTMPIRMDFKITVFNPQKNQPGEGQNLDYYLEGELNVDGLYDTIYRSDKGTSFEITKKLSEEIFLGFATNCENTQDNMTWINPADYLVDYIKEICISSFKNKNSFITSYIDFYYNLCFLDVETQLKEDISNIVNVGNDSYYSGTKNEDENITKLKLSNHPDYNNTNMYIDKFNILDEKTQYHIDQGYNRTLRWYDKNKKNYRQLVIKPIRENNNDKYDKEQPYSGKYLGKMDSDNVHENYLYANQHNIYNLMMLQKTNMLITIKRPNFSLYRFQKILVEIFSLTELDGQGNNQDVVTTENNNPDNTKINKILSGEWIITGINYTFSGNDGNIQEITLAKRSLNDIYELKNN